MTFDLADSIAVLERTPAALRALLAGLPRAWTDPDENAGTWSPFDVVGHLITRVAHDLGHVAQVARIMAKQYRGAVGPWREYLPVLDR
jgi:hypothetical protein